GLKPPIPAISNAAATGKLTPAQSLRALFTDDDLTTRCGLRRMAASVTGGPKMAARQSAWSALLPMHAGDHELPLCATLSLSSFARTRKTTFGSKLLALFQFLRVARRALLSLCSASDQSQSNGSGLIILRTPTCRRSNRYKKIVAPASASLSINGSRKTLDCPWIVAWQCWREPAGFGVYFLKAN
ncbi:hypothetical protein ABIB80_007830, partial [Bradyrhizobium sp. i1.15.2]|uniref:hypothetical protein n=1 Tax=Bradyrhizobium sp. i1.15.2 TaxID=3156362 RepID=UPI003393E3EB